MDKKLILLAISTTVLISFILVWVGIVIGQAVEGSKAVWISPTGNTGQALEMSQVASTISVIGKSNIKIKPELVEISLGIESCDAKANQANTQVNNILAKVLKDLETIGFGKDEVEPTDFSMYPHYRDTYSGSDVTFCANNQVEVTTKDLSSVSKIIDAAIASGVTNVYGVTFKPDENSVAVKEAIQFAHEDAEMQAKTLAALMNKKVGKVVKTEVNLAGTLVGVLIGYHGGGGSAVPQEGDIRVTLSVVYTLE